MLKDKNKVLEKKDFQELNLFRFVRTDEIGLSSILGFLLDPKESHGQGKSFLTTFLRKLSLDQFIENADDVSVWLEHPTECGRRHDIFVQGTKNGVITWVISIENKLRGAVDQYEQLKDYYEDLKYYHTENYFVLYLPNYKCEPSKSSIQNWNEMVEQKKGQVWTPLDLIDWLDDVPIQSEKLNIWIEDFKKFLEMEIMNMTKLNDQLLETVFASRDNIELMLDMLVLKDNFYNALKSKLIYQLEVKFNEDKLFDKSEWDLVTEENNYKYELIKLVPKSFPFVIHFERDSSGMYYGFKWKDTKNVIENEQYLPLIQRIARGKTTEWWGKLLHCPMQPLNLRYWEKETWLAIDTENQELATYLWTLVHNLWQQFLAVSKK
ncbi:hypothetical protein DRF63_06505 [Actinobacillus pleuropneumoniae]|uniref:PD-(D/E)XK nuclease superfamily n=1 Tax=Actinobacillus pleuropneumoniae TaxID=715 RepID=A0ABM6X8D3_ACTPL|nr:hypothetical protein APPSER1_06510 [Actinobacillus pleuropneumoniae serovar 1 str. 4074]AXA22553.1 hypothetical protein DRF63_06505 [Actinobacillus pleuropneumoniae]MBL4535214.1 PD-(D/E)XK nuclease family protein [Actinobacillus pleuropneumoniae]UKH31877.1 hypothetical protein D1104_06575 [Actinobacillus pleuropneumoniae serovar 11 str. 56153]UKH36017.1 hypothetical protein D1102_06540 [Actinobacillus pleuropneumoniae serovar 9 str. CVJ13261]